MLSFITEKTTCWEKLALEERPIFLYGMGDGAIKIMKVMHTYGIPIAGVFASDEFVRGHSFEGYRVHKLSEIDESVEDFVIVLAFGTCIPEMVDKIRDMAKRHTLYVPDVPVIGSGLFTYDYCVEHAEQIEEVYDLWADEISRKVYAGIINFKISGDISYLDPITSTRDDLFHNLIRPSANETFVDLGAYNGDTIREMLDYTKGKFQRIVAMEPDKKNFKKLTKFVGKTPFVECYNAVAWCKNTQVPFATKAGRQAAVSANGSMMEAQSVDCILDGDKATIIKMDVEGSEREALWGASHTITQYSPKLMISLYHRNEDIFELPLLVHKLNPKYLLYIRHQLYIPAWETNLYAVL